MDLFDADGRSIFSANIHRHWVTSLFVLLCTTAECRTPAANSPPSCSSWNRFWFKRIANNGSINFIESYERMAYFSSGKCLLIVFRVLFTSKESWGIPKDKSIYFIEWYGRIAYFDQEIQFQLNIYSMGLKFLTVYYTFLVQERLRIDPRIPRLG